MLLLEQLLSNNLTANWGQCYKEIYSQLRNTLFRSLDSQIGVRSKIWEPLVTPKSGLLNFQEIVVQATKFFYSIQFLKFPNFLGFRSPEMFIASAPDVNLNSFVKFHLVRMLLTVWLGFDVNLVLLFLSLSLLYPM